jgi:hypothetical protein
MTTSHFFTGFYKAASESPSVISEWMEQAAEARKKVKTKKEDKRVDPRSLSEWRSPDTWHRYGP